MNSTFFNDIEACIFDLDGVIVDTIDFHYNSWMHISKKLGIKFTKKDNDKLRGLNRMSSLEFILKLGKVKCSKEQKAELCHEKNAIYLDLIESMKPDNANIGIREFVLKLRQSQIKIGLGSSSKNARVILEKLDLKEYFDVIVDDNDVSSPKPHPEVFLKAAKLMNVLPGNTIVFEDGESGIIAAKSGGFKTIGVGSKSFLKRADRIVLNFEDQEIHALLNI